MSLMDPIDFAREFARRAHAGQEYRHRPYVYHLDAVAEIVTALDPGDQAPELRAVVRQRRTVIAYLHDVLEDTHVDEAALRAIFGDDICDCVSVMTDPRGRKRKERKRLVNIWLRQIVIDSPLVDALIVKAADRLANVRNCVSEDNHNLLKMYRHEYPEFAAAAHRPGLCNDVWRELDTMLLGESGRETP